MNITDKYVELYKSGDKDSFEYLYEETKKTVYLSIYTIVKNNSIIEDLMQDSYMKIIDKITFYHVGTNFKAWCSKIARNIAINYYNHYKQEILIDDIDFYNVDYKNDHLLDLSLSYLDGLEKDIFIYRIILNYKFKDIASILDIDLKHSFYLYNKVLKKLKNKM